MQGRTRSVYLSLERALTAAAPRACRAPTTGSASPHPGACPAPWPPRARRRADRCRHWRPGRRSAPRTSTTGTREARIAWIISRVEDSRPPGVSSRTITAGAPWAAARSSAFVNWPAETKPIAPLMSMTSTGRSGALWPAASSRGTARTQMHRRVMSHAAAFGNMGGAPPAMPALPQPGAIGVMSGTIQVVPWKPTVIGSAQDTTAAEHPAPGL